MEIFCGEYSGWKEGWTTCERSDWEFFPSLFRSKLPWHGLKSCWATCKPRRKGFKGPFLICFIRTSLFTSPLATSDLDGFVFSFLSLFFLIHLTSCQIFRNWSSVWFSFPDNLIWKPEDCNTELGFHARCWSIFLRWSPAVEASPNGLQTRQGLRVGWLPLWKDAAEPSVTWATGETQHEYFDDKFFSFPHYFFLLFLSFSKQA